MSMFGAIKKLKLADLVQFQLEAETTTNNSTVAAVITVIVIGKSEVNIFLAKDTNEYRGVVSFTVRDTLRHIVNCKFWGTKVKCEEISTEILKIGEIIDIIRPKVMHMTAATTQLMLMETNASNSSNSSNRGNIYQPLATLPYNLVLNESQSFLDKHCELADSELCVELCNLMRLSHKPICNALNLADIRANALMAAAKENVATTSSANATTSMQQQFVDLLVGIAVMRPIKDVKSTRTGKMLKCLELIVLDKSLSSGMIFTIWNADWIAYAQQNWQPMQTILHLIDIKVSYSEFYKVNTLNLTGRTLIFTNPFGMETKDLRRFLNALPIKSFDVIAQAAAGDLPTAEQIVTQMTVEQIYARVDGHLKDDAEQFTAVLFGAITQFDIDGQSLVISKKCKSCQRLLRQNELLCESENCQLTFSFSHIGDKFDYFFNINTQVSDHTGTLVEPRLSGHVAERIFDMNVTEFQQLNDKQLETLKWRFLMEYVEVKLLIKKPTITRKNLTIIIVDLRVVDLEEYSDKMIVF